MSLEHQHYHQTIVCNKDLIVKRYLKKFRFFMKVCKKSHLELQCYSIFKFLISGKSLRFEFKKLVIILFNIGCIIEIVGDFADDKTLVTRLKGLSTFSKFSNTSHLLSLSSKANAIVLDVDSNTYNQNI